MLDWLFFGGNCEFGTKLTYQQKKKENRNGAEVSSSLH
jgi:hypothetical protein